MTDEIHRHNRRAVAALLPSLSANPDVQRLLGFSLGRVLLNEGRRTGRRVNGRIEDRYRHIADWLASAVINGEAWLDRADSLGRPKKLMKFGSVEAILAEADKAMLKAAQKNRAIRLSDGDEELEHFLDDGWYVVRLLTPEALDRESYEMQHCIGEGSYDANLVEEELRYYSLRDPAGHAHVTMEINLGERTALQIQGKQNREPLLEYLDRAAIFLRSIDVPLGQVVEEGEWVYDSGWSRHHVDALPDGVVIPGDLVVSARDGFTLPENLEITGSLRLDSVTVKRFPKRLTVRGDYSANNCTLKGRPDVLVVRGSIGLTNVHATEIAGKVSLGSALCVVASGIRVLPDGITRTNTVMLSGCPVSDLEPLKEVHSLQLSNLPCKRLPVGLRVGSSASGGLTLENMVLEEWPEGLECRGSLSFIDTDMPALPDRLSVEGNLVLRGVPLERLPRGLSVGGNLTVNRTAIESLPQDLVLGGGLDISESWFRDLGNITRVNGDLTMRGGRVAALPRGLVVTGTLRGEKSELVALGEETRIAGDLFLHGSRLAALPADIEIGGSVDLTSTEVSELPRGLKVKGDLRLVASGVREIPEGLEVDGVLNITTTFITEFPAGVVVRGSLMADGHLKRLAPDTSIGGVIYHPSVSSILPPEPWPHADRGASLAPAGP